MTLIYLKLHHKMINLLTTPLSIIVIAILSIGYIFFNPAILFLSFFIALILISRLQLYHPRYLIIKAYILLSLILGLILILKATGTSLHAYILLSAFVMLLRFKYKYVSLDFVMQSIIIIYIVLSYTFLIEHMIFKKDSLAPDFNNVLSAYSIIPYFFIFFLKHKIRASIFAFLINIFLILSFSKTGWLIMSANIIFTILYLDWKKSLLLIAIISFVVSININHLSEIFIFKMTVSGFGISSDGHFYERLEIYRTVSDYLFNKASFFELLFGYNFFYNETHFYDNLFSNSGFFHSAFLEITTLGGIIGLIIYIIMQLIFARMVSLAFQDYRLLSFVYIIICLFIVNITSSIFLRYPVFMIVPLICIEVVRLRNIEDLKF